MDDTPVAPGPEDREPVARAPDATPLGPPVGSPALSISAARASEADGVVRVTVTLSGAVSAPVTVGYATADGTAIAGDDYTAAAGTLSFAGASTAAQQIRIRLRDDRIAEDVETFIVRLSEPRGAAATDTTATVTIVDNDAPAVTVEPAALNVGEGSTAHYTVALGSRPTAPVTVTPVVTAADLTITPMELRFTPAGWHTAHTVTVTAAQDSDAVSDPDAQVAHLVRGGNYEGVPAAPVVVTVVEDDASTLAILASPAAEGAGTLTFAVTLSLANDDIVTVRYATGADGDTATAGQDYTQTAGTLRFPARSTDAQAIEVTLLDDALDEPDEWFTVTLSEPANAALAGGGATVAATGRIDDDDRPPRLRIADAYASEGSGDPAIRFAVTLTPASARTVTVDYATSDGTATAGADYTPASGTLTFSPGATARTIVVPVADDALDETDRETFTATLSAAVHATVDSARRTATATIEDDDLAPQLRIADARASEGSGNAAIRFPVTLAPPSARIVTVRYATFDGTATAGADYTGVSGTLTFGGATSVQTIAVTILADSDAEGEETFTVTLSGPTNAVVAAGTATGTIADQESTTPPVVTPAPLELSSLQVTGGGSMYPAFDPGTYHYALTCSDSATLQVQAQASGATIRPTLLRADETRNVVATTATLTAGVTVNQDHDIAIRLSDTDGSATYVVHCLPDEFPDITVLDKTDEVTDGLLFVAPRHDEASSRYFAIVDNNGVPRFHRRTTYFDARNFRRHTDGRYSVTVGRGPLWQIKLLDEEFGETDTVRVVAPLRHTDSHDFLITDIGYLLLSYHETRHDLTPYGTEFSSEQWVHDSVIQEVSADGEEVFRWSTWDHREAMQIGTDCRLEKSDYAHVNSLQLVDGDIIASFRRCGQVLRIDRSGGTGAVEWKLGGTAPPADSTTEHLEIVDDPAPNEFCGQHQATLTSSDTVVLFDNGEYCRGERKNEPKFTRVVEYDISSGTTASYVRAFSLPSKYGYSPSRGGVTVLPNGRWLITWGDTFGAKVAVDRQIQISEVDPATGTVHLHMNISSGKLIFVTYRVYRYPESAVPIPLNLP